MTTAKDILRLDSSLRGWRLRLELQTRRFETSQRNSMQRIANVHFGASKKTHARRNLQILCITFFLGKGEVGGQVVFKFVIVLLNSHKELVMLKC